MKKRTYKRLKNRLYREIKARQQAEFLLRKPIKYDVINLKIDTICARHIVNQRQLSEDPVYYKEYEEREMLHQIAKKLRESGYIKSSMFEDRGDLVMEQRLDVVMR